MIWQGAADAECRAGVLGGEAVESGSALRTGWQWPGTFPKTDAGISLRLQLNAGLGMQDGLLALRGRLENRI